MVDARVLQQIVIQFGLIVASIAHGMLFGQTSGMVAALMTNEDELDLSQSQISWIASTINLSCILGFTLTGPIADKIGRKKCMTVVALPMIANWIVLHYAMNMSSFMISRVLGGYSFGGTLLVINAATGEYTIPKYRNYCLYINISIGPAIGTTLGHVLGNIFHWRTVALIAILPAVIQAVIPFLWVESPSWLAAKGRFDECEVNFNKLHDGEDAEKELRLLIEVETLKAKRTMGKESCGGVKKVISATQERYFWRIVLLTLVINFYMVGTGKVLFTVYASTMMADITGTPNVLFYTLLVDSFFILGACMAVFLIKYMKMRTLLLSAGTVANVLLIILSAFLYYLPRELEFTPWLNSLLLGLYFIVTNAGPFAVLDALTAEIFPLEIKQGLFALGGLSAGTLMFLSIHMAPTMFASIGYHGMFLIFAGVCIACQIYLYVYLPETKGRTLQEIELYFKNNKFEKIDNILSGDKIKV